MTKNLPAIQFYPGDFLKDPCVQVLSFESKSVWFFMILLMHNSVRPGFLVNANGDQLTSKQLANALQISEARVRRALKEMEAAGTFSRTEESIIYCRRMARQTHLSEVRREAGAKAKAKQKPSKTSAKTHASSSSSSSSSSSDLDKEKLSAAAASSNTVQAAKQPPQPQPVSLSQFPKTLQTIRSHFPATDDRMASRIVAAALARGPTLTDHTLAQALASTHQGTRQRSAALWLETLPVFVANGCPSRAAPENDVFRRARELIAARRNHACQ